jgi:hypothetical protein
VTIDSEMMAVMDSDGVTTTDSDRVMAGVLVVLIKVDSKTLLMAAKLRLMHG